MDCFLARHQTVVALALMFALGGKRTLADHCSESAHRLAQKSFAFAASAALPPSLSATQHILLGSTARPPKGAAAETIFRSSSSITPRLNGAPFEPTIPIAYESA